MGALNSTLFTNQGNGRATIPGGSYTKGTPVLQQCSIAVPVSGTGTNLNDTIGFFVAPRGAILRVFTLDFDQLDSNASPTLTFDVGDAALATRIMSAGAAGKVAGALRMLPSACGYQFLADTPLFATVHAAASTKVAGNLVATLQYDMAGIAGG